MNERIPHPSQLAAPVQEAAVTAREALSGLTHSSLNRFSEVRQGLSERISNAELPDPLVSIEKGRARVKAELGRAAEMAKVASGSAKEYFSDDERGTQRVIAAGAVGVLAAGAAYGLYRKRKSVNAAEEPVPAPLKAPEPRKKVAPEPKPAVAPKRRLKAPEARPKPKSEQPTKELAVSERTNTPGDGFSHSKKVIFEKDIKGRPATATIFKVGDEPMVWNKRNDTHRLGRQIILTTETGDRVFIHGDKIHFLSNQKDAKPQSFEMPLTGELPALINGTMQFPETWNSPVSKIEGVQFVTVLENYITSKEAASEKYEEYVAFGGNPFTPLKLQLSGDVEMPTTLFDKPQEIYERFVSGRGKASKPTSAREPQEKSSPEHRQKVLRAARQAGRQVVAATARSINATERGALTGMLWTSNRLAQVGYYGEALSDEQKKVQEAVDKAYDEKFAKSPSKSERGRYGQMATLIPFTLKEQVKATSRARKRTKLTEAEKRQERVNRRQTITAIQAHKSSTASQVR